MNKKSLIVIALLIFISSAIFISSSFAEEDRSYSIPFADIHLYIQENGSLHVVETIHYSFSGTWNGVYRDIPLKSNEQIKNLNVSTSGAYSKVESSEKDGMKHLKVYLYSDLEKTKPVSDIDVNVTYEYDFINVIQLYNDGATLHFTLWGDKWEESVGKLNAYIHLNNKTAVKHWLNPSDLVISDKWNNNTLEVVTDTLYPANLFELRMIIPKNYFNNATYASQNEGNGVAAFENLQKEYESGVEFWGGLYNGLSFLMFVLCFVPVMIYLKYGREPKITYQGIYEHEPPTKDSPVKVNSLYKGKVGSVDMDGFKATVLSLVNKKYLQMEDIDVSLDTNKKGKNVKPPIFIFNNDSDLSELSKVEKEAFRILKLFASGSNKLDLAIFEKKMKEELSAKKFRDYYDTWRKDAENDSDNNIEEIFISEGYDLSIMVAIGSLIFSGLFLGLMIFSFLPFQFVDTVNNLILSSILLLVVSIIVVILPNHIMGRWTITGRENNIKWKKFKKYLNEFSLMKENPPSSIVIWNDYLVYATALGVAKYVQKAMEKIVPKEILDTSDNYIFYGYGGGYLFSSFDRGISTANAADSNSGSGGSGGGFGGGSGGGGGGAF